MTEVNITELELRSGERTQVGTESKPLSKPMVLIELRPDEITIRFNGHAHIDAEIENMHPMEAKILHRILGEALDKHRETWPLP